MKRIRLLAILLAVLLLLCACGNTKAAEETAPSPEPVPTAEPEPTPTPFVEPVTEPGGEAYFDGRALADGYCLKDGVGYVRLSQVAEALGSEMERDGESFSFAWRKSRVELSAGETTARYLERDWSLASAPLLCREGEDLLVPVESLCEAAQIGYYDDAEMNCLYCTPATGDWELPEGYAVPTLMYHMVDVYGPDEANLMLRPETLEEQFEWLRDNGYTPIWFEDLWHIEDFDKPVILVFDDGYSDNYTFMFPLAQKFGFKVEVAIITHSIEFPGDMYLSVDQIREMQESSLVSFQSHSITHPNFANIWEYPPPDPEVELRDSALCLARVTKKMPVAFVYPSGGYTDEVRELVRQYYRFGVIMVSGDYETYVTGSDPTLVPRYFIERQTPIYWFSYWINRGLSDPSLKNYHPMPD